MNSAEQLLERYEGYLETAENAYRRSEHKKAREYFLLAADRLLEIAEQSSVELKDSRVAAANDLIEIAESIDAEAEMISGTKGVGASGDKEPEDTASPILMASKPETRLEDVAGLEDVKQLVREKLIEPFIYPEIYAEFGIKKGGGILLYGPPGTGKTMIASAVAGEVDAAFFSVLPGDIMSRWVGDPEKNIRNLFAEARKHERAVIFFDEIDALASSRGKSEDYMRRLVNQILAEIQGFPGNEESSLLVLGATNHPQLMDRAMLRPGRFDELVFIPLPDSAARRQLWKNNLSKRKRAGRFDYDQLADKSKGYSGAEIEFACGKASQKAVQRCKNGDEDTRIEMEDVLQVLQYVSPRTADTDVEELLVFAQQYDRNLKSIDKVGRIDGSKLSDESVQTGKSSVLPCHLSGLELEDFLDSVLSPFPKDRNLVISLVQLFDGKHISEITESIAKAVNSCYGAEKEILPDNILELGFFVEYEVDNKSPGSEGASSLTRRASSELPAYAEGAKQELLAEGMEIVDRYRAQLSRQQVEDSIDSLYEVAEKDVSGVRDKSSDLIAFEEQIMLAAKSSKSLENISGQEMQRIPPARDLPSLKNQAMALIYKNYQDLNEEDIRGLVDEIRNSKVIDLESFQSRVDDLARLRVRKAKEKELNELLEDRREFLNLAEAEEVENMMRSTNPDYQAIRDLLHEKTYRNKVENIVSIVCANMALSQKDSARLRRKTISAIERSGELPTEYSVRTRMKSILEEMREADRVFSESDQLQASKIEDVNQLLISKFPYDFGDVAGMESIKKEMEFAVEVPIVPSKRKRFTEITGNPPENAAMLLYGAPGCGKSFLAKAAAGEFARRHGFSVIQVPTRAISGLHYSKHTPFLADIFNLAKTREPSIVIWDEFDAIAGAAEFTGRKHQVSVCSELKSQFEGLFDSDALVVHIATCNYPWNLEPALMREGRLGRLIHIKPPDFEARKEIIEYALECAETDGKLDYTELAKWTEGMTTAELSAVIDNLLKDRAEMELSPSVPRQDKKPAVGMEELKAAFDAKQPRDYRAWLAGAERTLNLKKYASQKIFFQALTKDIDKILATNGAEPSMGGK